MSCILDDGLGVFGYNTNTGERGAKKDAYSKTEWFPSLKFDIRCNDLVMEKSKGMGWFLASFISRIGS
jgi:hypothetical protein